MHVSALMTRDVVTIGLDDTLADVREIFDTHNFHHLLVLDGGKVVGVVSDRDLLKHLSPFVGKLSERTQDAFTLQRTVHQVMSHTVVTVMATDTMETCSQLMLTRGVSCLPVVDDRGRCVGIVTWRDLLRAASVCGLAPNCQLPAVAPARPSEAA